MFAPFRGACASARALMRVRQRTLRCAMLYAMCCIALVPLGARRLGAQATSPSIPMTDPLGLPMTRIGSGTAWLPDSAPMFGVMKNAGAWMFMLHGSAFLQQTNQGGPRGDAQFGSVNWGMINAMRGVGGGRLQLRAMASADVFTVGRRGYPLLLQTGESYRGEALHDRQHPHDMLMEIAAVYERALTPNLGMQVYAAAAGEPALGPVAFPHRPAAAGDPFATLSHHWQDASHVSFGVATAGLYTRRVKVEGSVFNGREPDDVRTNLDYQGARLDSYAGRVSFNPTTSWALSASMGWLADAEKAHPGETVRRAVGSAMWSRGRSAGGSQSVSLIIGANAKEADPWSRSVALEGLTDLRGRLQLYTRVEVVEKSGEELVLDHDGPLHDAIFRVAQLTIGGVREVSAGRFGRVGLGARATVNAVPASLESIYGSRTPLGGAVFIRWRTSRMTTMAMDHAHMKH